MYVAGGLLVFGLLSFLFYWLPSMGGSTPVVSVYRVGYTSNSNSSALLTASGYVVAQRQAAVSSKATGRLVFLGVEEGDRVKEGEILARVESEDVEAELSIARANLDVARGALATTGARLKEARLKYDRVSDLLSRKLVSQSEFDGVEAAMNVAAAQHDQADAGIAAAQAAVRAAEVAVENTRIRAPFDGTVLTKEADIGEMVAPFGSAQSARGAVVTLADMSSLEVEADVSESNIQRVTVGYPVQIVLDAFPGTRYRGRVKKIVPTADRARATVLTKVKFLDIDLKVLPEMSANVTFLDSDSGEADSTPELAVPAGALVETAAGTVIFTVVDELARRNQVELGDFRGTLRVVRTGLREGDRVILNPPADLANGDAVEIK
jgi:RND family efflux transporter MFP subunit